MAQKIIVFCKIRVIRGKIWVSYGEMGYAVGAQKAEN
jgi:hypothetical protein